MRRVLHQAVATPSPSGQEAAVAEALLAAARERAEDAWIDAVGNLHVVRGTGPVTLLALGHLDTVPGELPVRSDDDTLHGRGSVDAKGPFCAALAAAVATPEPLATGLRLHLVGAVGEEAPGSPGAQRLLEDLPRPDGLLILEPSGATGITLGYKGHLRCTFRCERPSMHAAGPDASAADRVVRAAARVLQEADADLARRDGSAFASLGASVVAMKRDHDGVRERVQLEVSVRLPPGMSVAAASARLRELVVGDGVEVHVRDGVPAVRSHGRDPLARALRAAIRREGQAARPALKTGTSDWNVVHANWPVPTVAYGPGDAALDHAPDERVAWSEVERAVRVLRRLFRDAELVSDLQGARSGAHVAYRPESS